MIFSICNKTLKLISINQKTKKKKFYRIGSLNVYHFKTILILVLWVKLKFPNENNTERYKRPFDNPKFCLWLTTIFRLISYELNSKIFPQLANAPKIFSHIFWNYILDQVWLAHFSNTERRKEQILMRWTNKLFLVYSIVKL